MKTYQIRTKVKIGLDFVIVTFRVSRITFMKYYRKGNYEIGEINGTLTIFVFYCDLSFKLKRLAFYLGLNR